LSPSILAVSYFFHLVATVVWIGGLVTLVLLVLPAARRALLEQPTLYAFLSRIRRGFVPLSNLSLAVLIVTGLIQMSGDPNYDGLLQFTNTWSMVMLLKHGAILVMVILGAILQLGTTPALERALLLLEKGKAAETQTALLVKLHRDEAQLTWINVGLALLVLAFTAWATAI